MWHSPALPCTRRMNEAAALPSPTVVLSARLKQYYGRLRRPPGPRPLPGSSPVIGRATPAAAFRRATGPGRASPVPAITIRTFHALYAEEFIGAALPGSTPLPWPSPNGTGLGSPKYTFTTRQASLDAADRSVAHPRGMLDAALRPRAFPPEADSLLPGLLAATRTGPSPAGDDELVLDQVISSTNSKLLGALP